MRLLYLTIRMFFYECYYKFFTKKKAPWRMPTPPPNIKRIIKKMDNKIPLTEDEHLAIADWEDQQGGFAGFL